MCHGEALLRAGGRGAGDVQKHIWKTVTQAARSLFMEEALSIEKLRKRVRGKYDRDEQRVVGIMLARYNMKLTQKMIDECYVYWDHNSGKIFDVYWAGYGKYLSEKLESPTKTILKFDGNHSRVYFDLDAFVEIKNEFNEVFKKPYRDKLELILVNYRDGELHFDESVKIDLEQNLDENLGRIRELMEFLTDECRAEHRVQPIARKLKCEELRDTFKGITVSDALGLALGLAAL
jgi:hypothetical protein